MKKIFTIVALTTMVLALNAQHIARTMNFEGTSRKYMEYVPTSSPDGSMPVIFLLHGLGDNCNNFSQLGFEDVAPNWIIITPEATIANVMGQPMGEAWAAGVGGENVPYLGTIELNEGVNDDGFIIAILDSLENNFNVDTDSVFVAGFSMGGFMSNKMAVKHADRITAVASVSGTLGHFQPFEPTGNINTMHIHGTSDETISYADASFSYSILTVQVGLGAEALVETWRNYNQCSAEPTVYQYVNSKNDELTFEQYTYRNEETDKKTVFIKVNNGIHTWYDGYNNDIDYNREIYNFFIGKEPESFTLTSSAETNGSISPEGEIAVNESQYYTFTITPDEGYRVASATVDAGTENEANVTPAIVNNTYTFLNVMENHSINVTFEEIPTYIITSSAGENGTISPEGDTIVYEGTNTTFTITPDEGYRIASVTIDAETENEANVTEAIVNSTYTFQNVMANHSINVTFEVIPDDNIDINTADIFCIYPNPATDIVNIKINNNSELAIFNTTGEEVKHINTNQNTMTIDISDLPNGIYFVIVDGRAQKLTIAR